MGQGAGPTWGRADSEGGDDDDDDDDDDAIYREYNPWEHH